jgi:vacuolar-type H+-ATPase subunit H
MSQSAVEQAVKVLIDFEQELGRIKQDATESRKRFQVIAEEEGEKAKRDVLAKVRQLADERIARARKEAGAEASEIISKGEGSLKDMKEQISKKRAAAVEAVVKQLLGE